VILVITGASNAVNLTDGLDGLASGLVSIAALAFAGLCYVTGHAKFSEYLNITHLVYGGELTVFCMAVLGASLGFLWYNCHPADVFMGDTGSLALGGALGTVAVLIKREFWLVLIGGVFVAEALSVMIQVASFKLWGKRLFLMSPLRELGVDARFGTDAPPLLDGRDVVIWSPGVALTHPLAVAALAAGIPVLSELELGYLASQAPLVCVTGTNGKSTTTDLVGALIRATGREVEVCGNIGRAICEVAERVGPTGLLVTEVSSFQLETVQRLKPFIATWVNLTPDHLDRHGDLERYGAVKQRLFARQDE